MSTGDWGGSTPTAQSRPETHTARRAQARETARWQGRVSGTGGAVNSKNKIPESAPAAANSAHGREKSSSSPSIMAPQASEKKRLREQSEERIIGDLPCSLASLIAAVSNTSHAPPRERARPEVQYVSPQLQLLPPFDSALLDPAARRAAQEQACAVLRAEDALLQQLLEVRIITTHREAPQYALRNHINIRFSPEYCTMVHHERAGSTPADSVLFCFMSSNQLEPILVAVVVHPELGRLHRITEVQFQQLEVAIRQLKARYDLKGETYAYTGVKERLAGSWHSRHFHLKIRIPTEMYLKVFPAMQVLARKRHLLEQFKRKWEPVAYKFESQLTESWSDVKRRIQTDLLDSFNFE
jgi:hypothetical protein